MADDNVTGANLPGGITPAPPTSAPPGPQQGPDPTLPGLNGNPPDTDDGDTPEDTDADKRLAAERKKTRNAEKRATDAQRQIDALAAKVKQFEDRDKTEDQKRSEELDNAKAAAQAAQADAAAARLELLRYQVGAEKEVDPEFIPRLQGGTREEIEADADRINARMAERNAGQPPRPRRPAPDPRLGKGGAAPMTTADQFAAALRNRL